MGDEEHENSLGNIRPIKEGMLSMLHQTPQREITYKLNSLKYLVCLISDKTNLNKQLDSKANSYRSISNILRMICVNCANSCVHLFLCSIFKLQKPCSHNPSDAKKNFLPKNHILFS